MRNIFLAMIVICTLVVAGVGGTLAGFSDTETILDNKVEMGSIDLKVNDTDDAPYGIGIGQVISVDKVNPEDVIQEVVSVRNAGDKDGYLYVNFKNLECYSTTSHPDWWIEEPVTGTLKPEPEMVAEYGGKVNCTEVTGIGVIGENCSMGSHLWVAIDLDGVYVVGEPANPFIIADLEGNVLPLGVLEACGGAHTVSLWMQVPQLIDATWAYPAGEPAELAYWPTNALMADGISFDVELLLFDRPLP